MTLDDWDALEVRIALAAVKRRRQEAEARVAELVVLERAYERALEGVGQ